MKIIKIILSVFLISVMGISAAFSQSRKSYSQGESAYPSKGLWEIGGSMSYFGSINNDSYGNQLYIHDFNLDPEISYYILKGCHIGIMPSFYYKTAYTNDTTYDESYGCILHVTAGYTRAISDVLFFDISVAIGYSMGKTFGHSSSDDWEQSMIFGITPSLKYRIGNTLITTGLRYKYIQGTVSSYQYDNSHVLGVFAGISFFM